MRIAETKVYKFDELSPAAKEKARDRWRNDGLDYGWWDILCEEFVELCDAIGIEIGKNKFPPSTCGFFPYGYNIFFSGFYSQGDGACWGGSYRFRAGWKQTLKDLGWGAKIHDAWQDFGKRLQEIQQPKFYQLYAVVKHSGYYQHEMCTVIDVYEDGQMHTDNTTSQDVADVLRDTMRWLYSHLEQEYEWLTSDEQIDDTLGANEYEFEASGEIWNGE